MANRATRRVGCRISRRRNSSAASRKSPRSSPAPGSPSPFAARVAPGRASTPPRASATRALRDSIRIDSARWNVRRVLADPSRPSPDRRGATRARPGRTRARRARRRVTSAPWAPSSGSAAASARNSASRVRPGRSARRKGARRATRARPDRTSRRQRRRRARRAPPPPTFRANEADPRRTVWRARAEVSATPRVRTRARGVLQGRVRPPRD